jgi:hypothetical protein
MRLAGARPQTLACVGARLEFFCMISELFSFYRMDDDTQPAHASREKWVCCCASNKHKKAGGLFQVFVKW